MIKKLLYILVIACTCSVYSQNIISGTYFIGDKKASISADEMSYWIIHESDNTNCRLQYEENTPANEQIWTVRCGGKRQGTIVFKNDYSSGIYTDYNSGEESYVKKIE
jgi:hypothetical protein